MSRINDLIKKLCPNGMNFKSIDSVADLYYGKGNNIPKDGGDYPVYGCYGIVSSTSTFNNEDTPIVGHIGSAGKVSWGAGKHYVTYNGTICKPKNKNELNSRYLYHVLLNLHLENYVKGSQPFLSSSDFGPIKIAIPPLEIQEEIVKILDKFGKLEAELEAELEARKSQYEFWYGQIINENFKLMKIKDICDTAVGGDVPKDNFSKEMTEQYNIPIYSNSIDLEGLYGYTDISKINKPCVTLSGRGAGVGHAFLRKNSFFPIIRLVCLIPKEKFVTVEYLFYAIQLVKFKIPTTGIPQLTVPMVSEYEIPVPPLEEQNRIVNILSKFDKLINDISEGLPAEIELRRQQYEYYRNKLLSFEELINE